MEKESQPQTEPEPDEKVRGWTTEPVGNNATMKEHSHKEYEALDTAPVPDPGPGDGKEPPEGVGESTTRRGEDVHREDGRDFQEVGKTKMGRPIGTSDQEDFGVAGQKPISEDMPNVTRP